MSSIHDTVSCPECGRICVNRLIDVCMFCGETFPKLLRLTDEEKKTLRTEADDSIKRIKRKSPLDRTIYTGEGGGSCIWGDGCGDGGD